MPGPCLSVVMPAYDAAGHIADALASLAAQSRTDFEVIVVDDGSRDGTGAVVEHVAAGVGVGDPEIRLVRQANAGPSAARNRGIAEARAPLLGFLDADDRWAPGKVAAQVALMERHPEADLSFSGYRFIDGSGSDLHERFVPSAERLDHGELLAGNVIHTSTVVVRQAALDQAGSFDETLRTHEDFDLWLRVAALRPGNIRAIRDCLVDYRRHARQVTKDWRAMHAGWRTVTERAQARDPALWQRVERHAWGHQLEYCAALAYNAGEIEDARRLMRECWRRGGPAMARRRYTQLMTAIVLATYLPAPVRLWLSRGLATMRRLGTSLGRRMRQPDA